MLVLGVDPGLAITGYGLIEKPECGNYKLISYGVINTDPQLNLPTRLQQLFNEFDQLLLLHKPDGCAVEKLFFQSNVKTAMSVGEARGVILLALAKNQLYPVEYSPNEIKSTITGYGNADKKQIQLMVQMLLNLPDIPKPDDAADALATALCYLHRYQYNQAVSHGIE